MLILPMDDQSVSTAAELAQKLWPEHDQKALAEMFGALLRNGEGVCLLGYSETNEPVGFLQLSVRNDYVEGSQTSPVSYVEGIYVEKAYRGRGYGKRLIHYGEAWSKAHGFAEMGSDVELHNEGSIAFHEAAGFAEANRVVSYIKSL